MLEADPERKRISLTLRLDDEPAAPSGRAAPRPDRSRQTAPARQAATQAPASRPAQQEPRQNAGQSSGTAHRGSLRPTGGRRPGRRRSRRPRRPTRRWPRRSGGPDSASRSGEHADEIGTTAHRGIPTVRRTSSTLAVDLHHDCRRQRPDLGLSPLCAGTPTSSTSKRSTMGWLDRERTIAPPGFNRWLVPPAALAVHLCIGQAYATSVYKTGAREALRRQPDRNRRRSSRSRS